MTRYFHVLIYNHVVKTTAVSCHTMRPCQFSIEKARRTENEYHVSTVDKALADRSAGDAPAGSFSCSFPGN